MSIDASGYTSAQLEGVIRRFKRQALHAHRLSFRHPATGEAVLLPLCALFLGIAYGPYNPASAHVLADITTDQSRPLVFSIKQLGVPIGGMFSNGPGRMRP